MSRYLITNPMPGLVSPADELRNSPDFLPIRILVHGIDSEDDLKTVRTEVEELDDVEFVAFIRELDMVHPELIETDVMDTMFLFFGKRLRFEPVEIPPKESH